MTISEVLAKMSDSAFQIRSLGADENKVIQYEAELFKVELPREHPDNPYLMMMEEDEAGKDGWICLDVLTANALKLIYEAINDQNKAKFDRCSLTTLTKFAWGRVQFRKAA